MGSVYMTVRWRERCRLQRISAGWVHGYRDADLVRPDIGGFPPGLTAEVTRDHFLYTYVPEAGDTVLDIGAGIGEETLTFARLTGPGGRVLAIEAHPATFECLRATCARNHLRHVTPLQVAVSNEGGSATISDSAHHLSNTIMLEGETGVSVPSITIDQLADDHGVERIDFLKMNIEGAEELAIHGMRRTISQVRHAVIACHDVVRSSSRSTVSTMPMAREFLESNGYQVLTRDDDPRRWTRNTLYGVNRRLT